MENTQDPSSNARVPNVKGSGASPSSTTDNPVPPSNVPIQPPITLVEFLKRAAEENLANLLKETEGIQSQVELQDNRTPVMEPENPSQTKSPSSDDASHDSSLDRGIPADQRQLSPTQHPRAGRRKSPRYT